MDKKAIEIDQTKLNPGVEAIKKLSYLGWRYNISGNTLKFGYRGQGEPDLDLVRPLLDLVREHKKDVLHFLKCDCPNCGGVRNFWGMVLSPKDREIAKKKLRQRVEAWRRGPYREKFEKVYGEYLTRTYGPEDVEKHWYDVRAVIMSSKNPFHSLLETTWGDFAKTPEATELYKEFALRWPWPPDIFFPDNVIFVDERAVNFIGDRPVKNGEDPFLKNKRFINVSIDLYKPKKQIMTEINQLTDFMLEYAKEELPKKKVRGVAVDSLPFVVYDMHHREGKSLLQITYKLFPDVHGEDPNIDPAAKRCYAKVTRAYQKAKKLIFPA